MDLNLCFREKPKIIKTAENKNASSDGEPEAKRRKVHITETMVVQKVLILSFQILFPIFLSGGYSVSHSMTDCNVCIIVVYSITN